MLRLRNSVLHEPDRNLSEAIESNDEKPPHWRTVNMRTKHAVAVVNLR